MKRKLIILIIILTSVALQSYAQDDILGKILDTVNFDRTDLGYNPKGYWSRFPLDIPYRLTSFDDLFSEPLQIYDYSKTMAYAVEKYMNPNFIDTNSNALYYLTYSLGVDRKMGGFRNYSANLIDAIDNENRIEFGLRQIYGVAYEDRLLSLSDMDIELWKSYLEEIDFEELKLTDNDRRILGRLIINIANIIRWRNLALRNGSRESLEKIYEIYDLATTQADGQKYYPEIDDIAKTIDYPSMHYAALKSAALVPQIVDSLKLSGSIWEFDKIEWDSPYGKIILIGERFGNLDTIVVRDELAIIDNGGEHIFKGSIGATTGLGNPLSIMIDMGGDDIYLASDSLPAQGAGILGIGLLYDAEGNDFYDGIIYAQGCGFFGVGITFDRNGDDKYEAEYSAQGCGYFGIGLCFDAAGNDSFYVYGDGQGCGGVGGGIGVLADYSGNDFYKAEPSPEMVDLGDYHSEHKINANNSQGFGGGRRGDITDGHSWAGGMGALIDIGGDDHYLSGNFTLGTAYWFSTGIVYDGSGDDVYESCYFTQGSGAHFCNSALIDEGGNDKHELYETAGAALGFGWDFANAFLINIGGDDSYRANMISIGLAERRSNAFLFEIGGNDIYRFKEGALGLGAVDFVNYYRDLPGTSTYTVDAKSFGGFVDIGGEDKYISFTDSTESNHSKAANNYLWLTPDINSDKFGYDNYGTGIDVDTGIIPEIERWRGVNP